MRPRALILGHAGKLGSAIHEIFKVDYDVFGRSSGDFNAADPDQVRRVFFEVNPSVVVNTVVFSGIHQCDTDPVRAFVINGLYPRTLATLCNELACPLIHFSSEAVFENAAEETWHTESSPASPRNMYGITKYAGECIISATAERYYIIRTGLLFGENPKNSQFVEKMLLDIVGGAAQLEVAIDIFSTPTYTVDLAQEVQRICREALPYGLYHVVNEGSASRFEVIETLIGFIKADVCLVKKSFRDLGLPYRKNACTLLRSEKLKPMRPWRDALADYCQALGLGSAPGGGRGNGD